MTTIIPSNIKEAIANQSLLIFTGSGLSQKFGLPNWNKLVTDIIDSIDDIDLKKFRDLVGKPMKPIEVLQYLSEYKTQVFKYLEKNFKIDTSKDLTLHKKITELTGKVITTNYDNAFEVADSSIYSAIYDSTFKISNLKDQSKYVYKLHGCAVKDASKCILFKEDYDELYRSSETAAILKLKDLFINNTVLFIGFSFSDPYVVNLFDHVNRIFEGNSTQHYVATTSESEYRNFSYVKPILLDDYTEIESFVDKLLDIKEEVKKTSIFKPLKVPDKIDKQTQIAILFPDPSDVNLDIDIVKHLRCFDSFSVKIYKGYLNVYALQNLFDIDYVIMMSKTYRGKVYIEDENIKSKLVTIDEINNYIFDEKIIRLYILDSNVEHNSPCPTIVIDNFKYDLLSKVIFETFRNHRIDYKNANIFCSNIEYFPSKIEKGKANYYNLYEYIRPLDFTNAKVSSTLVGRTNDILNITKEILNLNNTYKILNIKGSGGIGKTTLIRKIAYDLYARGHFKSGCTFRSCENVKTFSDFEFELTQGFQLSHIANLKDYLIENSTRYNLLIILDNFETVTNLPQEEYSKVISLLEFTSDYANILITSREKLGVDFEELYSLASLTTDEALELFRRNYSVADKKDEINILRTDILENILNNNPLAIKIVTQNTPAHKSMLELKEELEQNFFEVTSANEYISIYKNDVDINVEKTKSLYHSINYSYRFLSSKEKLALEVLHIFPDGIDISHFKKWFNKQNKPNNINERDFKHLEDKSLVENFGGVLQLQPIIRRFAEFQFYKLSKENKHKYYTDAYGYNCFILDVIEFYEKAKSFSAALKLHDKFKNNLFEVLKYLRSISISEKTIVPQKKYLLNYVFGMKRYLYDERLHKKFQNELELLKDFFVDIPDADKLLKVVKLQKIYFREDFDSSYKQICDFVSPDQIENIIIGEAEDDYIKRRYINIVAHIHSMEGYTLGYIKFLKNNNLIDYLVDSDLFYLGILNSHRINKGFYYYERHFIEQTLNIDDLREYIDSLFVDEHLERMQCYYILAKVQFIKKDAVKKLVVTNPYTKGLKNLMFAFCEDDYSVKINYFKVALENLEHIKYYYLEALYYYCEFLENVNPELYLEQYQIGLNLARKFCYQYLVFKFLNIGSKNNSTYKCDYSYYQGIDIKAFVEANNAQILKYVKSNEYLSIVD